MSKRKKSILLTNDDGYQSHALIALRNSMEDLYDVTVVAPDRERSAISMAITLNQPLRVKQVEEKTFAVSGTPSDCVNIAMQEIMEERPDFILSGMNFGENISFDVLYSGTVGAAFSGHMYGVPSMAVSMIPDRTRTDEDIYDVAKGVEVTLRGLESIIHNCSNHIVYNLNIPYLNNGEIVVTTLGRKRYRPDVERRTDPRGRDYFWLGTGHPIYDMDEGTDVWAVLNGYISLSAIRYDLNCDVELEKLENLLGM